MGKPSINGPFSMAMLNNQMVFLGDFLWDFYGFLLDFYGRFRSFFQNQAMEKRLAEATKRLAPLRKFRQAGSFGGFNGNLWWFFMGSFMDFSWDIPENYGKLPRSHEKLSEFMDIPSGKLLHNELERSTMLFSLVNKSTMIQWPFSMS